MANRRLDRIDIGFRAVEDRLGEAVDSLRAMEDLANLLIETIRDACESTGDRCLFCGHPRGELHADDCTGIAAIKAAGVEM